MGQSVNKAILVGHLGKNPQLKYTQNGSAVCTFSLATNEKYGDSERVSWHNIVLWGRMAEVYHRHLLVGMPVFIEGRIQYRKWEDREGRVRDITEIVASHIQMLSQGKYPGGQEAHYQPLLHDDDAPPSDDKIPF